MSVMLHVVCMYACMHGTFTQRAHMCVRTHTQRRMQEAVDRPRAFVDPGQQQLIRDLRRKLAAAKKRIAEAEEETAKANHEVDKIRQKHMAQRTFLIKNPSIEIENLHE